jgi:hypothetical protein
MSIPPTFLVGSFSRVPLEEGGAVSLTNPANIDV